MKKIFLFLAAVLVAGTMLAQRNVLPNYTKPAFQGNVKVVDSLGTEVFMQFSPDNSDTSITFIDNSGVHKIKGATAYQFINKYNVADRLEITYTSNHIKIQNKTTGAFVLLKDSAMVGVNETNPNSTLHFNGSLAAKYRTVTTNDTLDIDDFYIQLNQDNRIIWLPNADDVQDRIYIIKMTDDPENNYIKTVGAALIDGLDSIKFFRKYQSFMLQAADGNWDVTTYFDNMVDAGAAANNVLSWDATITRPHWHATTSIILTHLTTNDAVIKDTLYFVNGSDTIANISSDASQLQFTGRKAITMTAPSAITIQTTKASAPITIQTDSSDITINVHNPNNASGIFTVNADSSIILKGDSLISLLGKGGIRLQSDDSALTIQATDGIRTASDYISTGDVYGDTAKFIDYTGHSPFAIGKTGDVITLKGASYTASDNTTIAGTDTLLLKGLVAIQEATGLNTPIIINPNTGALTSADMINTSLVATDNGATTYPRLKWATETGFEIPVNNLIMVDNIDSLSYWIGRASALGKHIGIMGGTYTTTITSGSATVPSVILKNGVNIYGINGIAEITATGTGGTFMGDNNVAVICTLKNITINKTGTWEVLYLLNSGTYLYSDGTCTFNGTTNVRGTVFMSGGHIDGFRIKNSNAGVARNALEMYSQNQIANGYTTANNCYIENTGAGRPVYLGYGGMITNSETYNTSNIASLECYPNSVARNVYCYTKNSSGTPACVYNKGGTVQNVQGYCASGNGFVNLYGYAYNCQGTSLLGGTPIVGFTNGVETAYNNGLVESGTIPAGGNDSTTIALKVGSSSYDNYYRGVRITITGGTGVGQSRVITSYVGSTRIATLDAELTTNVDRTSTYSTKSPVFAAFCTGNGSKEGYLGNNRTYNMFCTGTSQASGMEGYNCNGGFHYGCNGTALGDHASFTIFNARTLTASLSDRCVVLNSNVISVNSALCVSEKGDSNLVIGCNFVNLNNSATAYPVTLESTVGGSLSRASVFQNCNFYTASGSYSIYFSSGTSNVDLTNCTMNKPTYGVADTSYNNSYTVLDSVIVNGGISLNPSYATSTIGVNASAATVAGDGLNLKGGSSGAGSNLAGGSVNIIPGIPTGSGFSNGNIKSYNRQVKGTTPTTQQIAYDRFYVPSEKKLVDNVADTLFSLTPIAGVTGIDTAIAVTLNYGIVVTDGTDVQSNSGLMLSAAVVKDGAATQNTNVSAQTALSAGSLSGTYVMTWNNTDKKFYLIVTYNTSLTPATGGMNFSYTITNCSRATITQF